MCDLISVQIEEIRPSRPVVQYTTPLALMIGDDLATIYANKLALLDRRGGSNSPSSVILMLAVVQ